MIHKSTFPSLLPERLREVTQLDLSHNPMTYLGEESVSMAKLTHLYLNHMALQDLSEQAFSGAPLLSHLDISHNQLQYMEPLKGPKNLRSLNLTGTPVRILYLYMEDVIIISFLLKETRSIVTATCVP